MTTRHIIPDTTYQELQFLSARLGYKNKGERSKWILVDKMLAYARSNPEDFYYTPN